MEGDSQENYYRDQEYGDMAYVDDEQPQDMYGAAYDNIGVPAEYADEDAEDPYAGINIDTENKKVHKVEAKKKEEKPEQSEEESMQPSGKASEGASDSDKESKEKKVLTIDKELEDDSETEVNRARVEDEDAKEESEEAASSNEKVLNFQNPPQTKKDTDKGDALALAGQQKGKDKIDGFKNVESALSSQPQESQKEDDKNAESSTNLYNLSRFEDSAPSKQKKLKPTLDNFGEVELPQARPEEEIKIILDQPVKKQETEVKPEDKKSVATSRSKKVDAGDTYSYEDDFEQASVPATSRDLDVQPIAPKLPVEEQPSEEDKSSDAPVKPQLWSD